jgi:CBS-domain-containing membrane protein
MNSAPPPAADPAASPAVSPPTLRPPPRPGWGHLLLTGLAIGLSVGLAALLAVSLSPLPMTLALGASAMIIFGLPDTVVAQPRAVLGGHFMSSLAGLATLVLTGPLPPGPAQAAAFGLAMALASMIMLATRTVHPPAMGTALTFLLVGPHWPAILLPLAGGVLILIGGGWVFHRLSGKVWPHYWVGSESVNRLRLKLHRHALTSPPDGHKPGSA